MPMAPQAIEMMAPVTKAKAVYPASAVKSQMTTNMIATKIKQIRYYCFKNYMAPYIRYEIYCRDFFAELNQ